MDKNIKRIFGTNLVIVDDDSLGMAMTRQAAMALEAELESIHKKLEFTKRALHEMRAKFEAELSQRVSGSVRASD